MLKLVADGTYRALALIHADMTHYDDLASINALGYEYQSEVPQEAAPSASRQQICAFGLELPDSNHRRNPTLEAPLMADQIVVDSVHSQLETDVKARLEQAGEDWQTLDLGFYYGRTKSDEISIDLAMKAAMLEVLVKDHALLPDRVWTRLRKRINKDTVVSDAIDVLSQARDAEVDVGEDEGD